MIVSTTSFLLHHIALYMLLHRAVATGTVGTVFTGTLSAELTILCINVTHSRHSRGIYNCGAMPPSVYVYLECEASTIAWFPICSSSCSFTPVIATEMISGSLESKYFQGGTCPQIPSEHAPHATIIHSTYCGTRQLQMCLI